MLVITMGANWEHKILNRGLATKSAHRALGNRLVGILHGCLAHHTLYSETTAWAHRTSNNLSQAA